MKFKFYILISFIAHSFILIFLPVNITKERLKGQKVIPIEIIDNESFNSTKGNINKNSPKKKPQKIQDEKKELINKNKKIKENKDIKLIDKNYKTNGNFLIEKKENKEKFDNKKNINTLIKDPKIKKERENNDLIKDKKYELFESSIPQKRGVSDKDENKEFEKGSVKGKGKLKITCLNCISPIYPRKALNKGLEGKITIKVLILKSGEVEKAEIISSSGIISIDNAALEAAQKSKFYPLEYESFINIEYDLKIK